MEYILIGLLAGVIAAMMVKGLLRPGGVYTYPFLASACFFGFVLPQLPGLVNDIYLPMGAVSVTIIMAVLCAAALQLGWSSTSKSFGLLAWEFDTRRLQWIALFLTVGGAYFYVKLSHLPEEMIESSQFTGLPVAYLFFAKMLSYGFVIALLSWARTGSGISLFIAMIGAVFYLERAIIAGRRGGTAEFVLIILLSLWFARRRVLPRSLMLAGIVFATLALWSTGDYRHAASDGISYEEVANIDFIENLERVLEAGGVEMRNAVYKINAYSLEGTFDLGAFNWNKLVFNYVPAQLVGAEVKEMLYLPMVNPYANFDYVPTTGSTETGMSDAFGSFWYFGAVKFLFAAWVMSRLWNGAMRGDVGAQLVYMMLMPSALQVITHHSQWFLSGLVHIAIFMVPSLYLARRPHRPGGPRAAPVGGGGFPRRWGPAST